MHVPRLPDGIAGVGNLRGMVISVIDVRQAFGLPAAEPTERTCVIVVRVACDDDEAGIIVKLIVDEMSDVADLAAGQIESTPEFGSAVDTSFLEAIGRVTERAVLLLDIDLVLSS